MKSSEITALAIWFVFARWPLGGGVTTGEISDGMAVTSGFFWVEVITHVLGGGLFMSYVRRKGFFDVMLSSYMLESKSIGVERCCVCSWR